MEIVWIVILLGLTFVLWNSLRDPPEVKKPECYGTYAFRHPHITAERDCGRCPFHFDCYDESPYYGDPK
jgi:hypothetical protein